jgi:hypothetical protein
MRHCDVIVMVLKYCYDVYLTQDDHDTHRPRVHIAAVRKDSRREDVTPRIATCYVMLCHFTLHYVCGGVLRYSMSKRRYSINIAST